MNLGLAGLPPSCPVLHLVKERRGEEKRGEEKRGEERRGTWSIVDILTFEADKPCFKSVYSCLVAILEFVVVL